MEKPQFKEMYDQIIDEFIQNNHLQDIEKNLKAVINAIFNKFNLVTREEFDTQQKVLAATRLKIEELEQIVSKFRD